MENILSTGARYSYRLSDAEGNLLEQGEFENIVPLQGLNHILDVVFNGASAYSHWYLAPFEGNFTPGAGTTALTIPGDATECTAYEATTRMEFAHGAASAGAVASTEDVNEPVFVFTAEKTIYGVFLTSAEGKGSTTGTLLSAARFGSPRVCPVGAKLAIGTNFSIISQ